MVNAETVTGTRWALENSDVPRLYDVAVALTNSEGPVVTGRVTTKGAEPPASLVTLAAPIKTSPSPDPEGSGATLRKNSRRQVVEGDVDRVPVIVVTEGPLSTSVMTGGFCT